MSKLLTHINIEHLICVFAYVSSGLYEWFTKTYIFNHLYMVDVLCNCVFVAFFPIDGDSPCEENYKYTSQYNDVVVTACQSLPTLSNICV